ncbi:putative ABC transporter solute binding protein [Mycobacterium antarcticum]|uniref:metal ABC transporter solute-binding protein, Zn/Mn family n=1 Tax=unclassified Mycolicibacterium TaxID=2636767 RepID=UPI0023A1DB44|nr:MULTISPECIES: zinc ABC transporter substrate-binding protein [unclassified Mycolicibacterium]BDX30082.1 putative ABC transporter solute binding protein [Mycolicibacterium sp. TUM20985]GLP73502.1 putative ABC transporter solute binding protein [Mycolicibacterium sp. TUM20983]GLP79217.1 putative ABC transporter solute binding protein [Mycolicibacterium sp. TUM20984]
MALRAPVRTALALTLTLLGLGVAACGTASSPDPSGRPTVVATTDVWGSVAKAVAGEHADVRSILDSVTDDPHSYEATPSDAAAITDATLVVYNGGHYDQWADDILLEHQGVTAVNAYSLTPAQSDGQPANEHVFYDLATAKAVASSIADHLATDDPANADAYRKNAATFGTATDAIAETERGIGLEHPGAAVVSTEPVAHYLLAGAGITDRTPESFANAAEEGDDPSPADVAAMLDLIDGRQVSAVVVNQQTESPVTNQIQNAAGTAGVPLVMVTETLQDGLDYLQWQRKTVQDLADQLDRAPAVTR